MYFKTSTLYPLSHRAYYDSCTTIVINSVVMTITIGLVKFEPIDPIGGGGQVGVNLWKFFPFT